MSYLPKTTCCRSTPRCARCPVRLALEMRAREQMDARAALIDEVFRGTVAPLPQPVADALTALAEARSAVRGEPASAVL